jgi:hypothetical protein
VIALFLAAALAQEAPPAQPAEPDATIVVYGDDALREARAAVAAALEPLGWEARARGDVTVFKPPAWWIGRARLLPDGRLDFGRALAPLQGADLGATGMPGDDGLRPLPARVCEDPAAPGPMLVYAGRVLDGEAPLQGEHPVTISLHATAADATALWTETSALSFEDGAFVAILGATSPLYGVDLRQDDPWIRVHVHDGPATEPARLRDGAHPLTDPRRDGPCSPAPGEFDPFLQNQPTPAFKASVGGAPLPSRRRLHRHHEQALAAAGEALVHYRAVIAETALRAQLDALPARLDALWRDGSPMYGGEPIPDEAGRRAAVLELWATRADNPSGRRVAAAIEAWIADAWLDGGGAGSASWETEAAAWESRAAHGRSLPR